MKAALGLRFDLVGALAMPVIWTAFKKMQPKNF
jgi:hypothetical protein